jgi:hypothetical protein
MELYSSCYCVVSFPSVFSLEGGCPSIYTRRRGGDVAIPSAKPKHHRPSTWRHATAMWRRGRAMQAGGWPPLDHRLWPLPSCGRPWAGPTLLPGGVLLHLSWIDRRLCHSFTRFSIEKRLLVNFPCILCLWPAKHACTKTCGKCELKSIILPLVFIWAYFIWKLAVRIWS